MVGEKAQKFQGNAKFEQGERETLTKEKKNCYKGKSNEPGRKESKGGDCLGKKISDLGGGQQLPYGEG